MQLSSAAGKARPQIPGKGWSSFTNHAKIPRVVLVVSSWGQSLLLLAAMWVLVSSPDTAAREDNVFLLAVMTAARLITFSELDEVVASLLPTMVVLSWVFLVLVGSAAVFAMVFGSSNLDMKFE